MTVLAVHAWATNGHLIEDVARLGYIKAEDFTLDPTWGRGTWWKRWAPDQFIAHDRYTLDGVDFRQLPEPDETFDVVAFDPPYKLNGTPQLGDFDNRYGLEAGMPWQDRHELITDGLKECARVLRPGQRVKNDKGKYEWAGGILLLKCQDQVCSGAVRWQTRDFPEHAEKLGLVHVDRFDMLGGGRPQPSDRRQVHAHGRPSTLLVFRKQT